RRRRRRRHLDTRRATGWCADSRNRDRVVARAPHVINLAPSSPRIGGAERGFSILRRLTARCHLHEARLKPCEGFNEITLSRHHLVDVLIRHWHFVKTR